MVRKLLQSMTKILINDYESRPMIDDNDKEQKVFIKYKPTSYLSLSARIYA